MWMLMGQPYSVHEGAWPEWDEGLIAQEEITLVVQVNGKLRDRIEAPADVSEEMAKELALASEKVRPHVEGHEIRKSIYVPGRLVNFVVG
jgi:leucyl-tRNA synthetase